LRALGREKSEQILQAVRDLLREKSSFKNQPDWVTVLDASQEGAYEWVRCWPDLSIYALNHYFVP
jgi:apyrase